MIIAEAIKLARESDFELGFCIELSNFTVKENGENLENFIFKLSKDNSNTNDDYYNSINFNNYFDLDRLPPLNLNYDKLNDEFDKIDFIGFVNLVNSYLEYNLKKSPKSEFELKENLSNKNFTRWNFYIYHISLKFLIIVSLNKNFNYSEITRDSLTLFFQKILKIKSNFKKFLSVYKNGYLVAKNKNLSFTDREYELIKLQKKSSFDVSNIHNLNNSLENLINIDNNSNNHKQENNSNQNNIKDFNQNKCNNTIEDVKQNQNENIIKDNEKMDIEKISNSDNSKILSCNMENGNNNLSSLNIKLIKDVSLNPSNQITREVKKQNSSNLINLKDKNNLTNNYLKLLNYLKYNINQTEAGKILIQNSNYYELQKLSLNNFFDPYRIFTTHFHYMPFIDFISNKDKFTNLINNYQSFLLLIIMINVDEEDSGFKLTDIVLNFMPIFEMFYKVNEILNITDSKEFYNDYINKNVEVDFELECKNYLKYLKSDDKKSNVENFYNCETRKNKFCWLRYFWIFDGRSKSDILLEYNSKTQNEEFANQMRNIVSQMLNHTQVDINPYLIMQIQRNNMIEDSLNFLANQQVNFKKPLKIKFVGEQGIDEGGVKKEYFLLLVRQIFNPEYGMFIYNEKTRFFWFNGSSFEAKIKFELIGIIFGLAFYNNVILDVKLPHIIYKKLLNIKPILHDLHEIDEELYKNFLFLLDTKEKNLKDLIGANFTAVQDSYGEKQMIPLKVII